MFFQTNTFLTHFRKQIRFSNLDVLSTKGVACLFGRLGRHEARQQKRLGEKESSAPKFPQGSLLHDASQHKCICWGIVAGIHLELIEWLNAFSNLWHAWLCSHVYGWIRTFHFLSTMAPKTNAEIPGTNAEICGISRNGVQCGFWSWIALLRATCLHWHVASIPQGFYMAIWVQTLVSSNSVRTKIALHI